MLKAGLWWTRIRVACLVISGRKLQFTYNTHLPITMKNQNYRNGNDLNHNGTGIEIIFGILFGVNRAKIRNIIESKITKREESEYK